MGVKVVKDLTASLVKKYDIVHLEIFYFFVLLRQLKSHIYKTSVVCLCVCVYVRARVHLCVCAGVRVKNEKWKIKGYNLKVFRNKGVQCERF